MRTKQASDFLNSSGIHTFNPLFFPLEMKTGSSVNVTGGTRNRGGVHTSYLRIITKEYHPETAIEKSHEIKEYLQLNLKGAFFNGIKVLSVDADTPEPLYIGEENGVFTVSMNYTIIEG